MTTREKAPTILTAEGARRLTARIRDALALADDLLVRAYEGRAWEALGHRSWEDYCAAELPELQHIKLRPPARRERTKALHEAGATEREIASATGASAATAHRDVLEVTGRSASFEASPPLPPEIIEACTAWQVVLRHVIHAGATGLTCLEFEGETGRGHGAASAAFHSCERKSYIKRDGRFRGSYAVYVTGT